MADRTKVGEIYYDVTLDTGRLVDDSRTVSREVEKAAQSFNLITTAIKIYAAAQTLIKAVQLADEFRLLATRVDIAAGSLESGAVAMRELVDISKRTQTSIEANASVFARLNQSLTVPTEGYLYAYDLKTYQAELDKYGKGSPLYRRFDLPAGNTHAVVQKTQWLEQVRISGTQREPVGAWVAAEMPVPRGGLIGRKTYVELPLWSSEETKYNLRAVTTEKLGKVDKDGKDTQPKGWLVDFSGRDVLVDFDGGKVSTRVGSATREDDVQTELLIVRPDGRLTVRKSGEDMPDPVRQQAVADFTKWVADVKGGAAGAGGTTGTFAPKN